MKISEIELFRISSVKILSCKNYVLFIYNKCWKF